MKLKLQNVRLSFCDLFTAVSKFDGDPKFSAMFIVDPKSDSGKANLASFKKIVRQLESEKLAGKELPTEKLPIQDGNGADGEGRYSGWDNKVIISSANKRRPVIVGKARQPVAETDLSDVPESGDFVNAIVDLWCMDHQQFGQRIIASLEAVQYVKAGEKFSSKTVDVNSDFDDLSDDADVTEVDVKDAFSL